MGYCGGGVEVCVVVGVDVDGVVVVDIEFVWVYGVCCGGDVVGV